MAGARVGLVQSVPVMPFDVPRKLARMSLRYSAPEEHCYQSFSQYLANEHAVLSAITQLLESKQLNLLNPTAILCADGIHCRVAANGEVFYRDSNHLTSVGAFYIKPALASVFQSN